MSLQVFVDPLFVWESRDPQAKRVGSRHGHRWSHMWCNPGEEEALHAVARRIGLKREWFQEGRVLLHYDLTPTKRAAALRLGVVGMAAQDWIRAWRLLD